MNLPALAVPPFVDHAACIDEDPSIFFPEAGGSSLPAKAVCGRCEVRDACLAFCMEFESLHPGSRWGIYAGTTPEQRRDRTPKRCVVMVPRARNGFGACRKVIEADGLCRDHLTDAARARLAEARGRFGGAS